MELVLFYLLSSCIVLGTSIIIKSRTKVLKLKNILVILIPEIIYIMLSITLFIISLCCKLDSSSYFYYAIGMSFLIPALLAIIGIMILLYKQKNKLVVKYINNLRKKISKR